MKAPQRFIYVIGPLEGAQKVGLTTDPKARLATLQTGCPQELVIHVAVRVPFGEAHVVERRAHRMLERSRVKNEWFDLKPNDAIEAVLEATKAVEVSLPLPCPSSLEGLPLFAFRQPHIGSAKLATQDKRAL